MYAQSLMGIAWSRQMWHVAIKNETAREKMSPDPHHGRTIEMGSVSVVEKKRCILSVPMPLSPQGHLHWSSLLGLLLDQLPPSSVQSLLFLLQAQLKYHFFKEAFWVPVPDKALPLEKDHWFYLYFSVLVFNTFFGWFFFFPQLFI